MDFKHRLGTVTSLHDIPSSVQCSRLAILQHFSRILIFYSSHTHKKRTFTKHVIWRNMFIKKRDLKRFSVKYDFSVSIVLLCLIQIFGHLRSVMISCRKVLCGFVVKFLIDFQYLISVAFMLHWRIISLTFFLFLHYVLFS